MTEHPSNPDQLMARALGVCWHSPTADRWPCRGTETPSGADDDEGWQQAVDWHAGYDAGQRRAEEKLARIRELLTFLNSNDPAFREQHERYFLRALGEPDR